MKWKKLFWLRGKPFSSFLDFSLLAFVLLLVVHFFISLFHAFQRLHSRCSLRNKIQLELYYSLFCLFFLFRCLSISYPSTMITHTQSTLSHKINCARLSWYNLRNWRSCRCASSWIMDTIYNSIDIERQPERKQNVYFELTLHCYAIE